MRWAATPKKWARLSQSGILCATRRRYASWTRAVGCKVAADAFVPKISFGQPAQFVINERREQVHRRLVTLLPLEE